MRTLERIGAVALGLGVGLSLAAGCSSGGYVDGADLAGWIDPGGPDLGARALELQAITPSAGSPAGGTALRLGGSMFAPGATVQIGSSAATQVHFESASALTAVSPPSGAGIRGLVPVTVRLPSGKSVTRVDLFRYTSPLVSMSAPTFYTVTSLPFALLATELNGDGVPDVVAAGSDLRVFLGKRDGTLQPAPNPGVSGNNSFAAGDLNGDGKTDVVFPGSGVGVLLGTGNGTFQPVRYVAPGETPISLTLADLNRDEKLDLVVGKYTASKKDYVEVLLGRGDGSFEPPAQIAVGINPHHVTTADLNGDGRLDLAVALYGEKYGMTLLGNGDGTFQSPRMLTSLPKPIDVEVADLNGDGKLDLVMTAETSDLVAVHLGNGDGSFAAFRSVQVAPTGTGGSYRIAVADLNGDAVPDLAACMPTNSPLSVLLGNGDGSFQAPQTFAAGATCFDIATLDLNGDGLLDLALTNTSGASQVAVLLNTTMKP